jgi:outer membrane protein OmpA-like peptidoglycan-associated protein
VLIAVVHFATASSTLGRSARSILDATQAKIAKGGFTHAILMCHTDDAGPLAYNMALSAARCASVAAYVKHELGIAHVTYRQTAYAYLRPVAPNTSANGMAKNRRVEVYVK